jgi:hypothetical protein
MPSVRRWQRRGPGVVGNGMACGLIGTGWGACCPSPTGGPKAALTPKPAARKKPRRLTILSSLSDSSPGTRRTQLARVVAGNKGGEFLRDRRTWLKTA